MDLGDAKDFLQHQPSQGGHQGRPQINRQEGRAGRSGAPHAAVEGPGRAVDRQRECVDVRVADDAFADVGPFVTVIGHTEQHPDVAEGNENDGFSSQHGA